MSRRYFLSLVVLTAPLSLRADDKKTPDAAAIRQLVGQLGSDDFDTRENAAKRLLELDEAALPALKDGAKSTDAEVRQKAEAIAAVIAAHVEERAIQRMFVEIDRAGLAKFIDRLANDKDFASDEHWQLVRTLAAAAERRAAEVADRPFRVVKLDVAKLPTLRAMPETTANTARIVLNNDTSNVTGLYNCVLVSNGSVGRLGTLNNCVVIVNGDIEGVTVMRNCVVLCRGSIGRTRQIDTCVVLAAGNVTSADTINASLIDVGSVGRCVKSFNNVYLNMAQSPGFNSTDDQCKDTKSRPAGDVPLDGGGGGEETGEGVDPRDEPPRFAAARVSRACLVATISRRSVSASGRSVRYFEANTLAPMPPIA